MAGGRCPPPDPPAGRPTPAAYDLEIFMSAIACAALSGLLLLPLASQGPGAAVRDAAKQASGEGLARPVPWTRRHVEHLFNRAGFGAREGDIQWALKIGPVALVDQLLDGGRSVPPPHHEQGTVEDLDRGNDLPRAQKRTSRPSGAGRTGSSSPPTRAGGSTAWCVTTTPCGTA